MRVWVTRDEDEHGLLCSALRGAGQTPVLEPVVVRRVVNDCALVIGQLQSDDWLVLTSPFAVRSVAEQQAQKPNVAVVGDASAAAAEARGFRVELVSPDGDAESLFAELRQRLRTGKVCYARSTRAVPPKSWGNVEIISPVLYETTPREFDRTVVERVDIVTVVSPSAVEALDAVDLPFASLGPTTTKALRKLKIKPAVQAKQRNFASLAAAIEGYERRKAKGE